MDRPEKHEYADFYAGYIALVEETDVIAALQNQTADLQKLLGEVSAEKEFYRYADGKWSIREIFGHLIDAERVFSYRALRISRGDETALAGFDENFYVANGNFADVKIADSFGEFSALRQANVRLFDNLTDEMRRRIGTASDTPISVRALAYIMVGHVRHHVKIMQERYLGAK